MIPTEAVCPQIHQLKTKFKSNHTISNVWVKYNGTVERLKLRKMQINGAFEASLC